MKSILDRRFKYRDSIKGHTSGAFARRMKAYARLVQREAKARDATVTPISKHKAAK